ncbi:hypothetical protein GQ607_012671 [Colletotrichum asianum]|uniref:Xylanolytic transcriptional activator regulatory domain-containing protein n=1 Tax=Colletotrichum asianum TaxID=702518 RepID=A0A8H3ZLJ5_9PEZI|nr:hypothetical protein GQ607_012671 [Colletotrichum asianum]
MPTSRNSTCYYGSSSKAKQPPPNDLNTKEHPIGLASCLGPRVAKRHDPDDLLTSHLFATLKKFNLEIEDVLDGYLRSIHLWIPIIHPISLKEQVSSLQSRPSAELACLLLHMLLITPSFPSASGQHHETILPSLYEDCKSSFLLLQTYSRRHLKTVQSGLLLAIYEQGRGLMSDAYATLAICASLGYIANLHQSPRSVTAADEERLRVWWAVCFLDRLDFYANGKSERALLVHDFHIGRALPREDEEWSSRHDCGDTPLPLLSFPVDGSQSYGLFASEIQALYALQSVMQLTRNASVQPETLLGHEFWKLDMLAQRKIRETLTRSWKRLDDQYTMVALIELHEKRLTCAGGEEIPFFAKEASVAALESAINIAQDLLHMEKAAGILELDRMPLTIVILYNRVGCTAVLLGKHHGRDTEDLLRVVIQRLSEKIARRWDVANHIASQLREALPQSQDTCIA